MRKPRRSRVEAAFDLSVLPKSREFLGAVASRSGWDAAMAERLDAACEETLLTLIRQEEGEERRLRLVAYREGSGAVLEFVVASRDENVQDRLALLGDEPGEAPAEEEVSLRLLRRLASSVRHQQYRGMDVVTVRVAAPGGLVGGRRDCLSWAVTPGRTYPAMVCSRAHARGRHTAPAPYFTHSPSRNAHSCSEYNVSC